MNVKIKKKQAAVLGLGVSGRAAAQFLMEKDFDVIGIDQKAETLQQDPAFLALKQGGFRLYPETHPLPAHSLDLLVISPGISSVHPLVKEAQKENVEIIGEIELACRYLNNPFIAITGTNGKTTTTLLTAHILNHQGIAAIALGNIGTALTSQVNTLSTENPLPIIVAELSSFQLETMHTQMIDAAVILNITPDHLDRYDTMENYAKAKILIKDLLKNQEKLFVYDQIMKDFADLFGSFKPHTYGSNDTCGRGKALNTPLSHYLQHDRENIYASYLLCKEMGLSLDQFLDGLASFKKPAHRIEFVRTYKHIDFYNDSKGTNLDAVLRAVQSIDKQIILIAGGIDKGAAYTPWIPSFKHKVKGICAIGQAAPLIHRDLTADFSVKLCASLDSAIEQAIHMASPGDAVLLSPGCASQDMFRDYVHRGDVFKNIVNAL